MRTLKRPYLEVKLKEGYSFGGNQGWFAKEYLKKSACGVVSAADVILHLQGRSEMSEEEYMGFAKILCKKYLPVIPKFGMNGLMLTTGLNRYFFEKKLPYRAYWNISSKKMLTKIDEMLSKDIPVILSVGPNFPQIWQNHKVKFYSQTKEENFVPVTMVKGHYVIVTGREDLWLQISSWGKKYYIDYKEYENYAKKYSSFLLSNIVCIREIKKIR